MLSRVHDPHLLEFSRGGLGSPIELNTHGVATGTARGIDLEHSPAWLGIVGFC